MTTTKRFSEMTEEERAVARAAQKAEHDRRSAASRIDVKDVSTADLDAAIVAVLSANDAGDIRGGWMPSWGMIGAVQRQLGYDNFRHPGNAFDAKLKRRMNALATQGTIVKVSARESLVQPDGKVTGSRGDAHWAMPEVAARIHAQHDQAITTRERNQAAWEERTGKLAQWASVHDIEVEFNYGGALLSLDTFEALLVKLMETS